MDECLQAKREHDGGPPADGLVRHSPPPCEEQRRNKCSSYRGWKTRGKIVLAEDAITRSLKPIGERRFVEAILIIEIGNDVIVALNHFPRGLRETRFVAIDQRQAPCAGEVEKETAAK